MFQVQKNYDKCWVCDNFIFFKVSLESIMFYYVVSQAHSLKALMSFPNSPPTHCHANDYENISFFWSIKSKSAEYNRCKQ
jgi:hypothetical protein